MENDAQESILVLSHSLFGKRIGGIKRKMCVPQAIQKKNRLQGERNSGGTVFILTSLCYHKVRAILAKLALSEDSCILTKAFSFTLWFFPFIFDSEVKSSLSSDINVCCQAKTVVSVQHFLFNYRTKKKKKITCRQKTITQIFEFLFSCCLFLLQLRFIRAKDPIF